MRSRSVIIFLRTIIISSSFATGAAVAQNYVVDVDESMQQMAVEARFDEPVYRIGARSDDADRYLIDARNCANGERIRTRGNRLVIPAGGIECLYYRVDLERAARDERRNSTLSSSNVIVSTAAWLWRPSLNDVDPIRVRFELDNTIDVSIPWQPVEGRPDVFELSASPQSSTAPTIFGSFEYFETDIPGATLRVTVLNGEQPLDAAALVDWVAEAAAQIAGVYGEFPNPSPSVVFDTGWEPFVE